MKKRTLLWLVLALVIFGGGFNNIEGSTWQVIFEIEDGRVVFDTMMQGSPLRVGGRIFD